MGTMGDSRTISVLHLGKAAARLHGIRRLGILACFLFSCVNTHGLSQDHRVSTWDLRIIQEQPAQCAEWTVETRQVTLVTPDKFSKASKMLMGEP